MIGELSICSKLAQSSLHYYLLHILVQASGHIILVFQVVSRPDFLEARNKIYVKGIRWNQPWLEISIIQVLHGRTEVNYEKLRLAAISAKI
jgi:hypothetical protein